MHKYFIGLLTFFFAVISHAENAVDASVAALPPTYMAFDQPVRTFALVLGVVCVTFTFHRALFRQQPEATAKVKVAKD